MDLLMALLNSLKDDYDATKKKTSELFLDRGAANRYPVGLFCHVELLLMFTLAVSKRKE